MSAANQRPVLFLSSTASDLAAFREVVIHVCQRLGIDLVAMEEFGPDPRTAAALCQARIAGADLFLGLYAHRYGHTPEGFGGKSITQLEYEWAMQRTPPPAVLPFVMDDEHPWPKKLVEGGEAGARLETFKAQLRRAHVVSKLTTPEQLKDDLFVHLPKFRDNVGTRVVAPVLIPRPPEPYVVHQYTLLQTSQVIGRERDLATLDGWVSDPASTFAAARVLCVVAIGGMGKSALTWKWFHEHAPRAMAPLAGRFWWSFYESDAGFDRFVSTALGYCSGQTPEAVAALSPLDRENQLLGILDRQPFLLVLDGLERILIAYSNLDFAHLADEELDERTANRVADARGLPQEAGGTFIGQHRLRKTIDPRVGNFLRKLARTRAARILVTTRLYPSELQTVTGYELPGTAAWFLRGMERDDALALWRAMGVSGSDAELVKLFATIDHYPLLIRALAGEVAAYRRAPGDFDAWRKAHPDFDPFLLPLVQAKSHVLAHALTNLDAEARDLLHTIAAFRSPVDYDTVAALFVERRDWSSQKLDGMLAQLEDRGLLGWDRRTNRYDLHPIVRGVVWRGLDERSRRAVYGTLERHFSSISGTEEGINTLAEATAAIELFNALVGLGRYEEASNIYFDRIHAGKFGLAHAGLHYIRIAMLESFFAAGLDRVPMAAPGNVGPVLTQLAHAYAYSGRLTEAHSLYLRRLEIPDSADGNVHAYLARHLRSTGDMRSALDHARISVKTSVNLGQSKYNVGLLALCEATCGKVPQAVKRLAAQEPDEYYYADVYRAQINLWQGNFHAVMDAAEAGERKWPLMVAEAQMNLGKEQEASALLTDTLRSSREETDSEGELVCLRLLADLHRRLGEFAQARAYLDDLAEPAARGPYRLIQADAANVLAEIERDCGNRDEAIAAARVAYERAWCDGPPYAYDWGLKKAKRLLQELGATSN